MVERKKRAKLEEKKRERIKSNGLMKEQKWKQEEKVDKGKKRQS